MIYFTIIMAIIFIPLSILVDKGRFHPLLFAILFFPPASIILTYVLQAGGYFK